MSRTGRTRPVPAPHAPPAERDLPYPLTFFLRAGERRRVLRVLRALDADRSRALVKALAAVSRADRHRSAR